MGRFNQTTGLDDIADQLLLANWPAAHMVRFRRAAGNRLAAGEAASVELCNCFARNRKRKDATFPGAGAAGGSFHARIAGTRFHVSLLMHMMPLLDLQLGDRIVTLMAALV